MKLTIADSNEDKPSPESWFMGNKFGTSRRRTCNHDMQGSQINIMIAALISKSLKLINCFFTFKYFITLNCNI